MILSKKIALQYSKSLWDHSYNGNIFAFSSGARMKTRWRDEVFDSLMVPLKKQSFERKKYMLTLIYALLLIAIPCFAMFQDDLEEPSPRQITFMATHTKQAEIDAEMAYYDDKMQNLHQQMIEDWEAKHVGAKDLESRRQRFEYRMAQDRQIRRQAALQNAVERANRRYQNPNVPQVVYSSSEFQGMRN